MNVEKSMITIEGIEGEVSLYLSKQEDGLDGLVTLQSGGECYFSLQLLFQKKRGQVIISGTYGNDFFLDNITQIPNKLEFFILSDQTFIAATLQQLEQFLVRYSQPPHAIQPAKEMNSPGNN